ncbi:MAG: MltA domain-containing protein [Hyphomicrobiales bacterium]
MRDGASTVDLVPLTFTELPGWDVADLARAWRGFRRSSTDILGVQRAFSRQPLFGEDVLAWRSAAAACLASDEAQARSFFETTFRPHLVEDSERPQGLFTGYYEAQANGSFTCSPRYRFPVLAGPKDLHRQAGEGPEGDARYGRRSGEAIVPYFTRADIETGALDGQGLELLWVDSAIDLYFIHIQGSGRILMEDGSLVRLAYAAKNGHSYTSIGARLIASGDISAERMSMQTLRAWLAQDEARATALMRQNASYIFFRLLRDMPADLGPPGAQEVGLDALASLAVDRRFWPLGMPVWLDTVVPDSSTGGRPFRTLLIAQDTGSAIRGGARGDIFFGAGEEAAFAAGHMKAPGRMIVLLPNRPS